MIRLIRLFLAAALIAAWGTAAPLAAAESAPPAASSQPRLAAWLDAEVGLCLEFDNLAEQWAASAWRGRVARFPPLASWLQKHRRDLAALSGEIERRTGAAARDVGAKLLGRQVLLAIWPPRAPAAQPLALLLVESADEPLLRRSLGKLIAARRRAGRWRGQTALRVADREFLIDSVAPDDERSEFFLTTVDNVAVIATSEALVREALEHRAAGEQRPSCLTSSPAYRAANERLANDSPVRLFINPRVWDSALEADLHRKPPDSDEAQSQAALVAAWKATQYVAGGVRLAPQLAVELGWRWQADALPEPVREVAGSFAGASQLVENIPADALAAFAAHADAARLVRYAIARQWRQVAGSGAATSPAASSETKTPAPAKATPDGGAVVLWALAAGVGPEWGGYLTAASEGTLSDSGALPFDFVAGVQTQPLENGRGRPALAESLEPLVHALLSAAVEAANVQSGVEAASISSTSGAGRNVTTISGIVPGQPGQELAYCVDQRQRFWLGGSSTILQEAASPTAEHSLLKRLTAAGPSEQPPSGVLYLNLAGWRKLLAARPDALDFLFRGRRLDVEVSSRRRQALLEWTQLADRLTLAARINEANVHISLAFSDDAPGIDTSPGLPHAEGQVQELRRRSP